MPANSFHMACFNTLYKGFTIWSIRETLFSYNYMQLKLTECAFCVSQYRFTKITPLVSRQNHSIFPGFEMSVPRGFCHHLNTSRGMELHVGCSQHWQITLKKFNSNISQKQWSLFSVGETTVKLVKPSYSSLKVAQLQQHYSFVESSENRYKLLTRCFLMWNSNPVARIKHMQCTFLQTTFTLNLNVSEKKICSISIFLYMCISTL